jgi:hypothetical protein
VRLWELIERAGTGRPFDFAEIWIVDFEYNSGGNGKRIRPLCMVAREARSGRELRLWRDDLVKLREAPFAADRRSVVVSFAAWAELECFRALGWRRAENVIDLHAEHRVQTNGLIRPTRLRRDNLLTASRIRGLDPMDTVEKTAMRELILSKNGFSDEEAGRILAYCAEDVRLTEALLLKMLPHLDVARALWRGRYAWPVAAVQETGVPVDVRLYRRLTVHWADIKRTLIRELDTFGIFRDVSFNEARFAEVVHRLRIPWPRYPNGHPQLDDDTFKAMALAYPAIQPIRELRNLLSKMRLIGLTVDEDEARNRFLVSPWQTITSRNAPSNSHSVFGPSVWLRQLITPAPGTVLLYCDWSSQEYIIAAALAGDERMLEDCAATDPYVRFGQHGRLLPEGASKKSHPTLREQLKVSALATLYGQIAPSLAPRLGISLFEASRLLDMHARLYPRFHSWQRDYVRGCMATGLAWTKLGWPLRVTHQTKHTTLMNWPMQSHGAEMLRIAMVMLEAAGIRVCSPVHDAVLVECRENEAEVISSRVRSIMTHAAIRLIGVAPLVEIIPIAFGDRLVDKRGVAMW